MTTTMNNFVDTWFATQVDRCFETGMYGSGYRLYVSPDSYIIIEGVSYDGEKNILEVKDRKNNVYVLSNEPDNESFKKTLFQKWETWDRRCGFCYGEDRCDYKPWAFSSLKALAIELKLCELDNDVKIYIR